MKFKIPFPDATGVYFRSSKKLNSVEQKEKIDILNRLCQLVEIEKIGYRLNDKDFISVQREKNNLIVSIDDQYLL